MGKASKELTENRNEAFIELNQDYREPSNTEEIDEVYTDNDYKEQVENCTLKIHQLIMNYVADEGLHMCEFLDMNNLESYVYWLLKIV